MIVGLNTALTEQEGNQQFREGPCHIVGPAS